MNPSTPHTESLRANALSFSSVFTQGITHVAPAMGLVVTVNLPPGLTMPLLRIPGIEPSSKYVTQGIDRKSSLARWDKTDQGADDEMVAGGQFQDGFKTQA
jgi:hypothetical protein